MSKVINKGTGAGGAKTVLNGGSFEKRTSIESKLLDKKFTKIIMNKKKKYGYYYEYNDTITKIIYLTQGGFKLYFKKEFNIDIPKHPDEAFLILRNGQYFLKILEKKNQNVEGSVEDKLKTGRFIRREYEKMLSTMNNLTVSYAFCVSKFLQDKFDSDQVKYKIIKEIMIEDDIKIFYGDDENYFDCLYDNYITSN